jgi:methylmalonyl-CoA mutase
METGYQRGKIQDESMLYEQSKHDGSLPVIGVNTFPNPDSAANQTPPARLARGTEEEKESQLARVHDFQQRHRAEAHAALAALKDTARSGSNMFAALMEAARVCSLQQVTEAFFEVGGQYRRNM